MLLFQSAPPEGDLGPEQSFEAQCVYALRRRMPRHVFEVVFQECLDLGTRQVVDPNFHETTAPVSVPFLHAYHSCAGLLVALGL